MLPEPGKCIEKRGVEGGWLVHIRVQLDRRNNSYFKISNRILDVPSANK